jgi:carboxyl-terminal processing protease
MKIPRISFLIALITTILFSVSYASLTERLTENDLSWKDKFHNIITSISTNSLHAEQRSVDDLYRLSIEALMEKLGDQHSLYMTQKQYSEMRERIHSTGFSGVGISISPYDYDDIKGAIITEIFDDSSLKGIAQPGDIITKIDGTSLLEDLSDVSSRIRGPTGTYVDLTLVRVGEEIGSVRVQRKDIVPTSVTSANYDCNVVFRLSRFTTQTHIDLATSFVSKKHECPEGIRGVLFDLRGNTGGSLSSSIVSSNLFVESGRTLIKIIGTNPEQVHDATDINLLPYDIPIVILANESTASASEIFIGNMIIHRNAIVVGNKTYGKGSIQSIIPLNDGSAIKVTTAIYISAGVMEIDGKGIEPHIPTRTVSTISGKEAIEHRIMIIKLDRNLDSVLNTGLKALEFILDGNDLDSFPRELDIIPES